MREADIFMRDSRSALCFAALSILSLAAHVLLPCASRPSFAAGAVAAPALKQREESPPDQGSLSVPPGTHILLSMINSVSTRQAAVGDRIYLETAFPVLSGNRIVDSARQLGHGNDH